jgi:phosphoglycolate phosphatase-like HAD superfamily hydrolase
MQSLSDYDVYIFDCDGVILDSNQLKIDAMRAALSSVVSDGEKIEKCIDYFRNNFGKSRFHHIEVFVDDFLGFDKKNTGSMSEILLNAYSSKCKTLYLSAELTPGFIEFIDGLNGPKYVASGSEQGELRDVFRKRGLDIYFEQVFGSPVRKPKLISDILSIESTNKAVMFGDALSDLDAAIDNGISFIAYLPFSNVKKLLANKAGKYNFTKIDDWKEL